MFGLCTDECNHMQGRRSLKTHLYRAIVGVEAAIVCLVCPPYARHEMVLKYMLTYGLGTRLRKVIVHN